MNMVTIDKYHKYNIKIKNKIKFNSEIHKNPLLSLMP